MSKSFLYFLWWVSLFVFLGFTTNGLLLILSPIFSITGDSAWVEWIGALVGLIIFLPIYQLFQLLPKIKTGSDWKKVLISIFLLALWFLVPFVYRLSLDKLLCVEASITGWGGLPARCFK